jgi:hypothetical protein
MSFADEPGGTFDETIAISRTAPPSGSWRTGLAGWLASLLEVLLGAARKMNPGKAASHRPSAVSQKMPGIMGCAAIDQSLSAFISSP